jgi:pimeloyl-ACP methyl ester carboxylesterase
VPAGSYAPWRRLLRLAVVLPLAAACATPVGVERVDARRVARSLTANVLTTGEPSGPSTQALGRNNLAQLFREDPPAALAELHRRQLAAPNAGDLFALSELSFAHAERRGGAPYYLAAAIYAWAFLFPERGGSPPDAFDPRLRVAADLYNRGLTSGLEVPGGSTVDLGPRVLPLPFGTLEVASHPERFLYVNRRLVDFVPVAELEVRGLRSRFRWPGIGAPLAARIGELDDSLRARPDERWLPLNLRLPCTALLRLPALGAALASGTVRGELELYIAGERSELEIGGREVPLEFEPSAALAYTLVQTRLWDVELSGFFGRTHLDPSRLVMMRPHVRGRIPVVFVHGTASSPARWAEMINELSADAELRGRFEAWLFFYNTGNPILYSALQLRRQLAEVIATFEPDGRDPGLQRMVVIGHSQGGLLTKLLAVDAGERFWSNVSELPIEQIGFAPDLEAEVRAAFFFEALPQVRRVVFIATPHGGSYRAGLRVGNLAARLLSMPADVVRMGSDLFQPDRAAQLRQSMKRIPTSIDNMTPGNPFLDTLRATPLAPGVTGHSIIAVRSTGPLLGGDDGVVRYQSAHIEGVASEKVVRSSHSVQGHPEAVAEVRRILLEHLAAP